MTVAPGSSVSHTRVLLAYAYAPLVATWLLGPGGEWGAVAAYIAACAAVSFIAALRRVRGG